MLCMSPESPGRALQLVQHRGDFSTSTTTLHWLLVSNGLVFSPSPSARALIWVSWLPMNYLLERCVCMWETKSMREFISIHNWNETLINSGIKWYKSFVPWRAVAKRERERGLTQDAEASRDWSALQREMGIAGDKKYFVAHLWRRIYHISMYLISLYLMYIYINIFIFHYVSLYMIYTYLKLVSSVKIKSDPVHRLSHIMNTFRLSTMTHPVMVVFELDQQFERGRETVLLSWV